MMIRRFSIANVFLLTILLCPALEGRPAEAQGLFRRLRSRIQSRFQPLPYQPQVRPPDVPQQQPSSRLQQRQPRRASPVNPPSTATDPTQAQGVTPAPGIGGQSLNKAPVDSGDFGGSILNQPSASEDASDSKATGVEPQATGKAAREASRQRPSLGIQVRPTRDVVPGLEVDGFHADSLADEAGLKKGDVIVAIDGKATPTVAEIAKHMDGLKGGDRVRARIIRGRTTTAIMIPLLGPGPRATGLRGAAPGQTPLVQPPIDVGFKVNDARGQRGVIVSDVAADSPAAAAGVQVGDRIVAIDGQLMIDRGTFDHELARRKLGQALILQLVRDDTLVAAEVMLSDSSSLAETKDRASAKNGGSPPGDTGGSVLEGARSMLGGLLGGKSKRESDSAPRKDEMALDDDEPIDQVVFESEINRALKKLRGDPPSLKSLELPPPGEAAPIDQTDEAKSKSTQGKQTAEELREEIRRLEQRLKELDSKQ